MEEQNSIVKNLENNNFQLEPTLSTPVIENKVSSIEKKYNRKKAQTLDDEFQLYEDTGNYIRNLQISKLEEIKNFKPDSSYSKNQITRNEEEEELHSLAKELKNIKTQEQIINIEDKIKKNDLFYSPKDIEEILGLRGLDKEEEKNEVKAKKKKYFRKEKYC